MVFGGVFTNEVEIAGFRKSLIEWFEREGVSYPWRETTDPYAILVSELMLQQTQIATVLGKGYYRRWMERFPDWQSLAGADEQELLKAWEGLGYYNRARNLQKAARSVVSDFGGRFPSSYESILGLPGVGPYTAGAVMSFAFDKKAAIVDGNVLRVLSRIFAYEEPVDTPASGRFFWSSADRLTPSRQVRLYNSAIMELGQRVCTRSSPFCGSCPVQSHCRAYAGGLTSRLPLKKRRVETVLKEEHVGIAMEKGRILLTKEEGSRRRGMTRLPELCGQSWGDHVELFRFDYAITKYKVSLRVHQLPLPETASIMASGKGEWYSFSDLEALPPMGAPYLKAIRKYQNLHDELNLSS
ncbi:MAG: A/G-specific adenine glycosylase [Verrucomicrobiales bacterium]|nr:A/G-specific adenine glycosylase [Verrucomicrobiales bacterium]